jgi:hypothetical protein
VWYVFCSLVKMDLHMVLTFFGISLRIIIHLVPDSFNCFSLLYFWQYYQNLFRNGECFLHIVSLLNGTFDEAVGEQLVLNVLRTLTALLAENDESKVTKYFAIVHACAT